MKTPNTIPRDFFPNMPDEVFDMWLEPLAEHYGWPFQTQFDTTEETDWAQIFAVHPLSFWVNCEWCRVEIDLATTPFCQGTRFRVISIIDGCVHGYKTLLANVADTKERFRACADFIRINGTIPNPIAVVVRTDGLEIVDGNHRIAALIHVGIPPGYKVPAWITKTDK